jgi:transcriptional regulator with XRE-family HTH domain
VAASESDREIAKRFVAASKHLSQEEAAETVGVSQRTISNWRADRLPGSLQPALRRKILEVLERAVGGKVRPPDIDGRQDGISDAAFWRRYDAIEASDLPEPIKLHKVDALAAAIRALVQDKDAAAAERRTRLWEMEAEAAKERNRDVREHREALEVSPAPRSAAKQGKRKAG